SAWFTPYGMRRLWHHAVCHCFQRLTLYPGAYGDAPTLRSAQPPACWRRGRQQRRCRDQGFPGLSQPCILDTLGREDPSSCRGLMIHACHSCITSPPLVQVPTGTRESVPKGVREVVTAPERKRKSVVKKWCSSSARIRVTWKRGCKYS